MSIVDFTHVTSNLCYKQKLEIYGCILTNTLITIYVFSEFFELLATK